MKKILLEDINQKGHVSFIYESKNDDCVVHIYIEKDLFLFHDKILLTNNEIECLKKQIKECVNGNVKGILWETDNKKCSLSLSLDEKGPYVVCCINVSSETYSCKACFTFSTYQLENIQIVDAGIDETIYTVCSFPKFNIIKTGEQSGSTDFRLNYKDSQMEVNKSFFLYDFEQKEVCRDISMFLEKGNDITINIISYSFVWLHLCKGNKVKVEMDDCEMPQSSISFTFKADDSILQNMLNVMK